MPNVAPSSGRTRHVRCVRVVDNDLREQGITGLNTGGQTYSYGRHRGAGVGQRTRADEGDTRRRRRRRSRCRGHGAGRGRHRAAGRTGNRAAADESLHRIREDVEIYRAPSGGLVIGWASAVTGDAVVTVTAVGDIVKTRGRVTAVSQRIDDLV